ncbi:MAG: hypothetical protein HY660_17115, partial [Armatimonadetes bacterium]|nr:hypothetical protein [Armatimonadota bacterium]
MPKALLLTLALAVGVGLAWSAAQAQPARRDVIVGLIQEPDVLNSVTSTTGATNAVLKAMMDFPVKYDPNWRITPNLITRVPTVENGDWVVR